MRPNPPTHPPTHTGVCVCVCPVDRDQIDRQLAANPKTINTPASQQHRGSQNRTSTDLAKTAKSSEVGFAIGEREGREGERQN